LGVKKSLLANVLQGILDLGNDLKSRRRQGSNWLSLCAAAPIRRFAVGLRIGHSISWWCASKSLVGSPLPISCGEIFFLSIEAPIPLG
jgi:hypothetical protein